MGGGFADLEEDNGNLRAQLADLQADYDELKASSAAEINELRAQLEAKEEFAT